MIADLYYNRGKTNGSFNDSASVVLEQFQNQLDFERNGFSVVFYMFKRDNCIALMISVTIDPRNHFLKCNWF